MENRIPTRLSAWLLTLVMLLSLVPAMGVTASAADDTSYDPGSVRNYVSFASQLESTTSRDLVLENDFEYTMGYDDDYIRVRNNQKLDLNGHKLRIDASRRSEFFNLITITSGEFTLYDSQGGGAIEVEFARDSKGHSIIMISPDSAGAPAKFTMNGGTLTRVNPLDSNVYGNNGCISDDYFNPFKEGERPQITINGGTINCAYDWNNREMNTMSGVQYKPTALLLRYSQLTVKGGTFNGIVWTDELSWRAGDAEPRVSLNGGVFNFPFAMTSLLKNKTELVIDGARFNDGLYVAQGMKARNYKGNEPAMLIKSGVFDASGQNLKLDIRSVTADGWHTSQGRQQAIAYAMKLFPNSAIKLNGKIYTSENIGSRVKYADTDGYYLNLNLKGPIEVIGRAWDLKEVLLDGSPIAVPNIRDGARFMVSGSVPIYTVSTLGTHELVYRWYDLAKELKDAGWSYEIECGLGPGLVNIYHGNYTIANGICEWRYRLPNTPANIDAGQMAFTISLRHATDPTSIVCANQYLLRYQVVKDTTIPIETVLLDMVNGDLLPSDSATANPIRKNAMDVRCERVVSQRDWADNGSHRNKTVVLEARAGFHFTNATRFVVKNAGSVTAEWLYSTDGGKTCAVGIEAQECTLLSTVQGTLKNFYMGRRMGEAYITADSPASCTFEIFEYACLGTATDEWEPIDDDDEYYEYYFYIVPPSGYAVRPGRTTVNIVIPGGYWADGKKSSDHRREAEYDDWMASAGYVYSYGYSWSIGRLVDGRYGMFPEYESAARTLYLSIKKPVAGESPTDTSYQSISSLPSDVKVKELKWDMDGDTVFQAGKKYYLEIDLEIPKQRPNTVWPQDYKTTVVYINGVNAWEWNTWGGPDDGTANAAAYRLGTFMPYTVPGGNDGVTVSGKLTSYNPNNPTTVELRQGGKVKYTATIAKTTGSGQVPQDFSFNAVAAGTYDLVVTKDGHLTYTVKGVVVGDGPHDLTKHSNAAISMITLLCGDIVKNGYIDFADYQELLSPANYGKKTTDTGVNELADLNGNGYIDFADYQILLSSQHYGKSAVSVSFGE